MAGIILDTVKVATTVNIGGDITNQQGEVIGTYTLTTKDWELGAGDSIDGVTDLAIGDRVLVKAQTIKSENGIYVFTTVNVSGVNKIRLVRSSDFAASSTIQPNTTVFIRQGDRFGDTGWTISNDAAVLVGTSDIEFKRFTVNENLAGIDLPSAIVLRSEKGFPLTNDELDGNFRYLANSLVNKVEISDYNGTVITEKINSLTAQQANLNSWRLRGFAPTFDHVDNTITIALRDDTGSIVSPTFRGDLKDGVADEALHAVNADIAINVSGIVQVLNGGTGSSTQQGARDNLNVVGRAGDRMTGTLVLGAGNPPSTTPPTTPVAPIRIELGAPAVPSNGDVWAAPFTNQQGQVLDYQLFYRYNNITKTVASLESPNFTGTPTTPNLDKSTNTTNIVNAKFVQDHVADLNDALDLKAPLASPQLTGTPTAPTAALATENTQIASTKYVADKIDNKLLPYATVTYVGTQITGLNNTLSPRITTAQQTADEALLQAGIPVGTVMHFAANYVPAGWLKCNGELVSKNVYPKLFSVIGYTYGGIGDNFRLPDLRGEFLRGFDDSRGVDAGRNFGTSQSATAVRILIDNYAQGQGAKLDGSYINMGLYSTGTFAVTGSNIDGFVTPPTGDASLMRYNPTQGTVNVSNNNIFYQAYATVQQGSGDNVSFQVRSRNVAMMPCIKAFGIVDTEDQIDFSEALNEINSRVRKSGDSMSGPLVLSGNPTESLHAVPKQYVDAAISNITLTPGPKGDKGDTGATGSQGPAGASYLFTYGTHTAYNFTNYVWYFDDNYNYADVFPPSGKTIADLRAFIPSINAIYFAGKVDGNDALRCTYAVYSDRIRVWVQNTEQRGYPSFNWLAVWRV